MRSGRLTLAAVAAAALLAPRPCPAAEAGRGGVFSVVEVAFAGPPQTARDAPARDIDFRVTFLEAGKLKFKIV